MPRIPASHAPPDELRDASVAGEEDPGAALDDELAASLPASDNDTPCQRCGGRGTLDGTPTLTDGVKPPCPTCGGTGRAPRDIA